MQKPFLVLGLAHGPQPTDPSAYKVISSRNMRIQTNNTPEEVSAWEALVAAADGVVITDRRTGVAWLLHVSFSNTEAAISWFMRENPSESSAVLCHDRADNVWYVEGLRPDCTMWLAADGTEVAEGEPFTHVHYLLEHHPNAIVIYGE